MKNKNTRGQVAQEALMSFVIYTLFILILLGALNYTLPQIQQKQEQKTQQEINIYRCTTIDNIAALQAKNIFTNNSHGTCIYNGDKRVDTVEGGYFEKNRELD